METDFPREAAFDEDYLYFYEELLTPERTAAEVDLVWKLLELEPGLELLDLACGHGRIANPLAERGVEVDYVEGDMRSLPWTERFDRVLCWFTSFGYFPDEENRHVLGEVHRALRPGGLFAVEMNHKDNLFGRWEPMSVTERGEDRMIDRRAYDAQTGRSRDERTIIRGGAERTFQFSVRMLGAAELKDWLRDAGFREPFAYGEDGEPITLEHRRMTVVGRK